jgi:hypothetical protein
MGGDGWKGDVRSGQEQTITTTKPWINNPSVNLQAVCTPAELSLAMAGSKESSKQAATSTTNTGAHRRASHKQAGGRRGRSRHITIVHHSGRRDDLSARCALLRRGHRAFQLCHEYLLCLSRSECFTGIIGSAIPREGYALSFEGNRVGGRRSWWLGFRARICSCADHQPRLGPVPFEQQQVASLVGIALPLATQRFWRSRITSPRTASTGYLHRQPAPNHIFPRCEGTCTVSRALPSFSTDCPG